MKVLAFIVSLSLVLAACSGNLSGNVGDSVPSPSPSEGTTDSTTMTGENGTRLEVQGETQPDPALQDMPVSKQDDTSTLNTELQQTTIMEETF